MKDGSDPSFTLSLSDLCARSPALLTVIPVGGDGRRFELAISLVQQVLGALRMTIQVPLVCLLSGDDSFVRLPAKPLCRGQIGVTPADIPLRRTLGNGCTGSNGSRT